MKKLAFFIFAISFLGMMGCVSTKKAVVYAPMSDSLKIFEQSMRANISLKDSVIFYNQTEIRLEKSAAGEFNFVQDGVIFSIDSLFEVSKSVQSRTSGIALDFNKKNGLIDVITISFSRSKEITYILSFFRKELVIKPQQSVVIVNKRKVIRNLPIVNPKSFILNSSAKLLFRGNSYDVRASTKGDGYCTILVDYRKKQVVLKEEGAAEGWKGQNGLQK